MQDQLNKIIQDNRLLINKKLINTEIIISDNIKISEPLNNLKKYFELYKFNVKNINIQNNSVNGILKKHTKQYFFKFGTLDNMLQEIRGYLSLKDNYPVPNLVTIYMLNEQIILIFDYLMDVDVNKGLLIDYINDNINSKNINHVIVINNILKSYIESLKNKVIANSCPIDAFYKYRIKERIIPWYVEKVNNDILNYRLIINDVEYMSTSEIINQCIHYFNTSKNLSCILTQGDPTEVNIALRPMFFDFQTSGYNYVVGELAIFFWSLYIAGGYFYPKYHKVAYHYHDKTIDNINKNKPILKYEINNVNKKILVKFKYNPNNIRSQILKDYIHLFNDKRLMQEINENLPYFLMIRIIGTLNIYNMEESDTILSMCFMQIFFKNDIDYIKYLYEII